MNDVLSGPLGNFLSVLLGATAAWAGQWFVTQRQMAEHRRDFRRAEIVPAAARLLAAARGVWDVRRQGVHSAPFAPDDAEGRALRDALVELSRDAIRAKAELSVVCPTADMVADRLEAATTAFEGQPGEKPTDEQKKAYRDALDDLVRVIRQEVD